MSPHCRMKRSIATGSFFFPVISVITEISDGTVPLSSPLPRCIPSPAFAQNCFMLAEQNPRWRVCNRSGGVENGEKTKAAEGLVRKRTKFPSVGGGSRRLRPLHARPHRNHHELEYRRRAHQGLRAAG